MIVFDLQCGSGHRFEGWFASADDYASQRARGLLGCPSCGSERVDRIPSASRLNMGAPAPEAPPPATQAVPAQGRDPMALAQILYSRMLDELLSKAEDVGSAFPAEARRIHYDEAPRRAIRGIASVEEHDALVDEGIPVARLPVPRSGRWN